MHHENVVALLDCKESAHNVFLVMEVSLNRMVVEKCKIGTTGRVKVLNCDHTCIIAIVNEYEVKPRLYSGLLTEIK